MAKRTITTDDVTGSIIEDESTIQNFRIVVPAHVVTTPETTKTVDGKETKVPAKETKVPEFAHDFEVSESTYAAIVSLMNGSPAALAEILTMTFKATRKSTGSDNEAELIRAWAKENGVTVNERGRVAADVIAKYRAATSAA
jgi:hypothetical protein